MMFVHLLPVVVMDFCEVWLTQASRPFPMLSLPDAVHDFRSPLDRINALSLRHQVSELLQLEKVTCFQAFILNRNRSRRVAHASNSPPRFLFSPND